MLFLRSKVNMLSFHLMLKLWTNRRRHKKCTVCSVDCIQIIQIFDITDIIIKRIWAEMWKNKSQKVTAGLFSFRRWFGAFLPSFGMFFGGFDHYCLSKSYIRKKNGKKEESSPYYVNKNNYLNPTVTTSTNAVLAK